MVDFAGSGVVHVTGGCTALYATIILGARQGRFHDRNGNKLAKPGLTKGHSVALQMLGTFILFFGWFGFNPGSALLLAVENKGRVAALAAVNTTLAAAAGTVSCLIISGIIEQFRAGEFTFDIVMAMNGCLSGLVAITAGCSVVEPWAAILIGVVSGWAYIIADKLLIWGELDDAVSAIQVHFANGLWGVIAVGLLASPSRMLDVYGTDSHPGFFYSPTGANLLPAQLAGVLFIVGWTLVATLPFFVMLDYFNLFRVNALEEIIGLDATYQNFVEGADMGEEPSEDNEEVRLAAYRQRFAERKKAKEMSPPTGATTMKRMEEVFNASWGATQLDNCESIGTSGASLVMDSAKAAAASVVSVASSASAAVEEARQLTYKQWKRLQLATSAGDGPVADSDAVSEQAPLPEPPKEYLAV
jgi:Amt family ammonium transporter